MPDQTMPTVVTVQMRPAEDGKPRTAAVLAEDAGTPGLAITPAMGSDGRFMDGFHLSHTASGYGLHSWPGDPYMLRRVAGELAKTPIDFTADKDTVLSQIKEHGDAFKAAWIAGRYEAPVADDPDTPKGEGIAPYPRTAAQATAGNVARHITRALQHRCQKTWDLLKRKDDDGNAIYFHHASAMVAEWGLVTALRALSEFDPTLADGVAREIWYGWEDGSTTHEQVYEWAREYGLPPLPDDDNEQATIQVEQVTTDA